MMFDHWQSQCEQFLQSVAPSDLDGVPIYLLDGAEIHSRLPLHVLGWTGSDALEVARLHCPDHWQGVGFATVLWPERFESWQALIGGVLHELAHWIDAPPQLPAEPRPAASIVADMAMTQMEMVQQWQSDPTWHIPANYQHEARFVRISGHLAYRAGQQMESIRPKHLRFVSDYYQPPLSENCVLTLLESELDSESPIRSIIATEPPERFRQAF
jgi:hypothetical protein